MQELYEHHFCAVYNSGLSVQSNWYDAARLAADEEPDSIEIVPSFNNIVLFVPTYIVFLQSWTGPLVFLFSKPDLDQNNKEHEPQLNRATTGRQVLVLPTLRHRDRASPLKDSVLTQEGALFNCISHQNLFVIKI